MNRYRRILRRSVLAVVMAAVALSTASPCAAADADGARDGSGDDEARCHRHDDLSCTIVRETAAGVLVWTERFRAADPSSPGWSISVGAGVITSSPTVRLLASAPAVAGRSTPNGAPILE